MKSTEEHRVDIPYAPVTEISPADARKLKKEFKKLRKTLTILDEDDVQEIRDLWRKKKINRQSVVFAQRGGQTDMLSSPADISIIGGSRGGGKSYVLLMNALYDILNPNFRAIVFRKDLDDLSDIIDTSGELFSQFGTYNRAKNDMTWNFDNGGWLTFSYHAMEYNAFHDRYQGKQYPYIGIDEVTQMSFQKFKILTMSNRNAYNIRSHIVGSCNPDPDSWVAKYIEWWIDQETGLPIPERAGKVRYCTMSGDDVSEVVWGDSREEVFEKCKDEIMAYWTDDMSEYGKPEDLFIYSVAFVPAKLTDNKALMFSNPDYLKTLFGQDDETKARFLDGNWKYKAAGSDLIKI